MKAVNTDAAYHKRRPFPTKDELRARYDEAALVKFRAYEDSNGTSNARNLHSLNS